MDLAVTAHRLAGSAAADATFRACVADAKFGDVGSQQHRRGAWQRGGRVFLRHVRSRSGRSQSWTRKLEIAIRSKLLDDEAMREASDLTWRDRATAARLANTQSAYRSWQRSRVISSNSRRLWRGCSPRPDLDRRDHRTSRQRAADSRTAARYNRLLSPMDFLSKLNPEQREAVLHRDGPLLILAGAGSGKTRVITYRIAYLIGDGHAEPDKVLAVTFTNKAAGEMRERVEALIGDDAKGVWLSTFHALCARLLRREAPKIGLSRDFVIYDSSDQVALIKQD